MQITVYKNFSKRINSTKVPASGGISLNVVIKDYSNIESPSFTLTVSNIDQNSGFLHINYVEAFDRKYFATCNVETSTSFSIDCTLDHLATFKSNIAGYTGLVEYTSASDDVTITDPRNKPTGLITATPTTVALSNNFFTTEGSYIVGVLGVDTNGAGGLVSYYRMTAAILTNFMRDIYDQGFVARLVDQFQAVQDSLISVIWVPINGSDIGGSYEAISIGRETMGVSAYKIGSRVISSSSGVTTVGYNTYSGGAGANLTYLEKEPYTTAELYLPFVGFVPVSVDLLAFTKSIQVDCYVDILTGDIVYKVNYGGAWNTNYNGNLATKMPISSASYDGIGVASGALTAIGGAGATIAAIATGGTSAAIMGGLAATAGGGAMAAKSMQLHTMINGTNSSAVGVNLGSVPFIVIYQNIPEETTLTAYKSAHGMPYFKVATLSSLSGYIQCADASISIPGNGAEQSVVNGYLNSGFYLE